MKRAPGRPKEIPAKVFNVIGVVGTGVMGRGIALVAALAGIDVRIKGSSSHAAKVIYNYIEESVLTLAAKGRLRDVDKNEVINRISVVEEEQDLAQCELVIECVTEDFALKQKILRDIEQYLQPGSLLATNTSSLPVTKLAKDMKSPERLIGLHFFSPAEKMKLVEIVRTVDTTDEILASAYDFVRQLKKTAILVNDAPCFFTTRTLGAYLDEGAILISDGLAPMLIDNLGEAVGMPLGPLALHDQVSLKLTRTMQAAWRQAGIEDYYADMTILREMVETLTTNGRNGLGQGGGFYDYDSSGGRKPWSALAKQYLRPDILIPDQDVKDRLLFRQVIEALRCLEDGILNSVAEGNVGSLLGIGAPIWTGGFIQFINTYGLQRFIDRCGELAEKYGERFSAPAIVEKKLRAGETFV